MRIDLRPIRSDSTPSILRSGNALVVNGEVFDFSPLADGDTLPATAINSQWFRAKSIASMANWH